MRLTETEFVELSCAALGGEAFKFVDSQNNRPARAPKPLGYAMVLPRKTLATIG